MKTSLATLMLLLVTMVSFAQLKQTDQQFLQTKVEKYVKLKKTGATLGIIGGGLTIASIVAVSNADWEETTNYDGTTQYNTTDASGVLGIVGLAVGIPMAVTGIVLNTVGSRKAKYYQEKLDKVHLGMFQNGQQAGITLAIKF